MILCVYMYTDVYTHMQSIFAKSEKGSVHCGSKGWIACALTSTMDSEVHLWGLPAAAVSPSHQAFMTKSCFLPNLISRENIMNFKWGWLIIGFPSGCFNV